MGAFSSIRKTLRGEVRTSTAALEAVRRINASLLKRRERAQLEQLNRQTARLTPEFARVSRAELLDHFRKRQSPKFFPGFVDVTSTARLQRKMFPEETKQLVVQAERITKDHCWPLLGFGEKCFGADEIRWNRDPLSGYEWPRDYHADINLFRGDGSDARVLWELNRLSHLITLGRAYVVTQDEAYASEFLRQIRGWRAQNPVGRGTNWSCAMEVALRAMNLLAAFFLVLASPHIDEDAFSELLMIFDQHGAHIRRNLEYSHIATSNHYLCDVAGLVWLGVMLPELRDASEWREFGLRELLNEADKQILPDGADSESSTGYHRLKLELLLYSFVLCRANGIETDDKYWQKLRAMCDYTRAYLRPDGRAPLIGDSDSGQILPIVKRAGDDHAYVLSVAAAALQEPELKVSPAPCEELVWLLGEQGLRDFQSLPVASPIRSTAFPDAGIYVLRDDDLYLLFNASGCGLNGRGSHGHNDALSIEVSAGGSAFLVDPGSYVYTHDVYERHLFRSTAFHSTVQVDSIEQNTTEEAMPFVAGDEAHPRVVVWETNDEDDRVIAEHDGYQRIVPPVTHRRAVMFDKRRRLWKIEDSLLLKDGGHTYHFRFHFADGLEISVRPGNIVQARDRKTGARLYVAGLEFDNPPSLEERFISRDYGLRQHSISACWTAHNQSSFTVTWMLVPIGSNDDENARVKLITDLLLERAQAELLHAEALLEKPQ